MECVQLSKVSERPTDVGYAPLRHGSGLGAIQSSGLQARLAAGVRQRTVYQKVLALPWWGWLLAAALSYMLGSETWWWMVCAAPVTNAIRMRQADAAVFEAEEAAEEDKTAS